MVNRQRLVDILHKEKSLFCLKYGLSEPKFWDSNGWKAQGRIDALAWALVFCMDESNKSAKEYMKIRSKLNE